MTPLDAYCLTLRKTRTGKAYITRAEWEDWFGDLVASDERRVSGWFSDPVETVAWCVRYCGQNPGCLTHDQARRLLAHRKAAA